MLEKIWGTKDIIDWIDEADGKRRWKEAGDTPPPNRPGRPDTMELIKANLEKRIQSKRELLKIVKEEEMNELENMDPWLEIE